MTRKLCLIGILAFFAIFANAAETITPQRPVTINGCYIIKTKEELYGFAEVVNGTATKAANPAACARLDGDIVVNEGVLTEDGYLNEADTAKFAVWTPMKDYRGTFHGQGNFIFGLYYNDETQSKVGLFANVSSSGGNSPVLIEEVGVAYSFFRGAALVGAIVGSVEASNPVTIRNVRNHSRIESKSAMAGGIVGYANGNIQLERAVNSGYVGADYMAGGVVGYVAGSPAKITNSYNIGVAESLNEEIKASYAGGIMGQAVGSFELMNLYNLGYVVGNDVIGGIAGNIGAVSVVLVNAYNAGPVLSLKVDTEYSGAILGRSQGAAENFKYANIYYETTDGYEDEYGVGLPKTKMQDGTLAYLLRNYHYEGLDASVWGQNANPGYPDFTRKISEDTNPELGSVTLHTGMDNEELSLSYAPGYVFKLPVLSYEGYAFQGWYDNAELNGEPVSAFISTAPDQREFWAKFSKVYTISYVTGSGVTRIGEEILSYVEGVGVTLPKQVSKEGFVFNGWYGNENLTGQRLIEIGPEASGDKTVYAKWLQKKAPAKDGEGCYVITNASELYGFAAIVNGTDGFAKDNSPCANLGNDIEVNENVLKQDGSINEKDSADFMRWTPMNDFKGTFDGKGHTISGLYYNVKSGMNLEKTGVGLFGTVRGGTSGNPVVVKNVGVEASYLRGVYNVGALIGFARRVEDYNYTNVLILNSYSTSAIRAYQYGGGLVGRFDTYVFGAFVNCYSVGVVEAADSEIPYREIGALIAGNPRDIAVVNTYYLGILGAAEQHGTSASRTQFENGTVAYALHNGEEGSIWGQDVGTDPLPNFNGVVKNYTAPSSSSVASSSSNSVVSSSSAKSSSSVRSSSSRENSVSSSSAKSSSSSAKAKSSSSGARVKSSSSKGSWFFPIALPHEPQVPQFHVLVDGLKVLLTSAKVGSPYALFDLQGRVILSGRVDTPDFTISVPYAGNYLLRIGYQTTHISVK